MIQEAEDHAEEDKALKEKIEAKNAFDGYLQGLKGAVEGSLAEKMDDDDKEKVKEALEDGESWLSANSDSDAEEIREKQKEVEEIAAPIISKYYGQGSGASQGGDSDDNDEDEHDEL